ncbi:hypothetical protein BUALT_Bualt10G0140400 [Buddleja alternifolia]|uniref:Histone-lysine N-methyltransferase n=1 Tax=Buddleja alternifolia TaxID=168488 RepID=A0AAV6WZT1_9LAMI|nr:hypothetical protein BUALT_Bualt10G0140400 [Buddleja alternifolia]
MEKWWGQSKCCSVWLPSSSHDSRAQFPSADCHLYLQAPQQSMLLTHGMSQEHTHGNMPGINNLSHADLGASFLSLLSQPSVHMPCDLQHLLDSKPAPGSGHVSLNQRTAYGFSAGSRVSLVPSALWSHNTNCQSLTVGEGFSPLISSNSAVSVNRGYSSGLPQAANLNFQKSQSVSSQSPHEKDRQHNSFSLIGNNNSSPISANSRRLQNVADITASQNVPVERNFSVGYHGNNPSSSFPRIFCSGISGNLLLSDTGLLGVVCSCHGLYMSISKFSEHSGSCDVNPGSAVRMENGETVAHWRNTYLSKSGIRVSEGHRGWDWPEEISAASGLSNHPISDTSNNTVLLNQVGPFRTSVSYDQKQYSVIHPKENQRCSNIVDEFVYHEIDGTSQECSNSLYKDFNNSPHGNLQHAACQLIMGMSNSFGIKAQKTSQSTKPKLDSISQSANVLPALPHIDTLRTPCNGFNVIKNTSSSVEGPEVSSNIELRLGQPPEQSRTLETKVSPALESNHNSMHVEQHPKVFFQNQLLRKGNELQRTKWALQFADIASNPCERRQPSHSGHSNHVGEAYGELTDYWKNSVDGHMEVTDLNPLPLSCFRNQEAKWQFRNANDHDNDSHIVTKKLHCEPHSAISDGTCFPWTRVPNAQNHVNKGKKVGCAVNGLLGVAKLNIEFSKTFKEDLSTSNAVLGESSYNFSPAFHEKRSNAHQMFASIADESQDRDIFNNCRNMSSLSDIKHFNHDHVKPVQNSIHARQTTSVGSISKNSVFDQSACLPLPKEKCNRVNPDVQDANRRMPAVNMLKLSNRDRGPASVRNVEECGILKNPCVQSLFSAAPSITNDRGHLLDWLRMPTIPEVEEKSTLPGTICWMGHDSEQISTITGRSLYAEECDLPPVERLFLRPAGSEHNFNDSKKEGCSQGLPCAYVPEKCSYAVRANCLTEKYDLNGHTSCNFVKEDRSREAASLFQSKWKENCSFMKERAKSFERTVNLVGPDIKKVESHSFQWRDVPKKITDSCSSTGEEQQAGSFNRIFGGPATDVDKCSTTFARNIFPLKEREISIASSGCSVPDVTQASVEVNKKDSCAVEGRNIRCATNSFLDEGSGNDRSWSSDDAFDNEHSAECFGSASRISLIRGAPLKVAPKRLSLSLIEEIRLQNLSSKNAPYQNKRSSTIQEESDCLQMFEGSSRKRKKTVKWMKMDAQFPVSGQSSIHNKSPKCREEVGQNVHSVWDMQMSVGCDQGSASNCPDSVEQGFKQRSFAFSAATATPIKTDLHIVYNKGKQTTEAHINSKFDDTTEAYEMFRKKKLRLDGTSSVTKQVGQICCSNADLAEKSTSLDCPSNSLGKHVTYKLMARPIVFGKYGIISNGNPSKPTKIIPLGKILKYVPSLAERSNRNATSNYINDKVKPSSVKVKKSVRHVKKTSRNKKVLESQVKKGGAHALRSTNGGDDLSYTLEKCSNNYGFTDSNYRIHLKTKSKESRTRSLYEFLTDGNDFKVVNSSVKKHSVSLRQTRSRYWGEPMEDATDGKVQRNEICNSKRCTEKHQPENSDTFCCVCGNSDKDDHNQLLECNRFLIKGLQSEAVHNVNVNFSGRCMLRATSCLFNPDGDTESPRPIEKFLTCARTEGYKGRKREGFLHSHPQDANENSGCHVPQEQLNAWLHIHRQRSQRKARPKLLSSNVESDCRKAYARYKQSKGWKQLVVYKSGIHALGLYTSQFISLGAMVVEYVGEIVGLRVADRRESEYHSGKNLQHKSACYFFRIDKEYIIDATRKGGIARFVNHSCKPNCVAKVISVRNEKKVVFIAERDIYPGEEITYDYHFNHEDEGEKIPCYCKSKNCRHYLN